MPLGDSPEARIWRALLPAIVLTAWFIGGLLIYAVRAKVRGEVRDADIEAKGRSALLGFWIRRYFVWVTRPFWVLLEATGIPANALTTLSAMLAIASGVALAAGHFALGGWLYIFSGILDVFDGRLARLQKTSGPAGAVLDSVLDRYADSAVLMGLAWFYRESWVLVPALLALAGSLTISYVRARAEGVGVIVKVGLMQRPERVLTLGMATALSPVIAAIQSPDPNAPHILAIAGLVLLAVSTQLTAAHRLIHVLRKLQQGPARGVFQRNGMSRAIVAAAIATGLDFAGVYGLVDGLGVVPWLATAAGCVLGGLASFLLGRYWAFVNHGARMSVQAGRYILVSATSAALNAGGVFVFTLLEDVDYRIGWVLSRALVFGLWNYPLHRDYVFGGAPASDSSSQDGTQDEPSAFDEPSKLEAAP